MDDVELMRLAERARERAYCKYSGFAVGAALLTEEGEVFTGCNVENASYSLGICAERTAFCKAISAGYKRFSAIAICGGNAGKPSAAPCLPCGACRQVMMEFCEGDFRVILHGKCFTLAELLPKPFFMP